MRPLKPLPDWFTEEFVKNHTYVELAEKYGSSPENIRAMCVKRNWKPLPGYSRGNNALLDSVKEEVKNLNAKQVSNKYNVPIKAVWAWCHSRKVSLVRRRKESKPKTEVIKKDKSDFSLSNKQSYGTVGNWYCNVRPKHY